MNPGREDRWYITALTGISSSDMVRDAPYFDELAPEIASILERHIFVAHNVNFDYSFVSITSSLPAIHWIRVNYVYRKAEPQSLSRFAFLQPGGNSAGNWTFGLNKGTGANWDTRATAVLFDKLLQHGAITHIDQMLKSIRLNAGFRCNSINQTQIVCEGMNYLLFP